MAVMDTIGGVVAGPIISKAFGWGVHLGGLWSGMSFLLSGLLYSMVAVPAACFGIEVAAWCHTKGIMTGSVQCFAYFQLLCR